MHNKPCDMLTVVLIMMMDNWTSKKWLCEPEMPVEIAPRFRLSSIAVICLAYYILASIVAKIQPIDRI